MIGCLEHKKALVVACDVIPLAGGILLQLSAEKDPGSSGSKPRLCRDVNDHHLIAADVKKLAPAVRPKRLPAALC